MKNLARVTALTCLSAGALVVLACSSPGPKDAGDEDATGAVNQGGSAGAPASGSGGSSSAGTSSGGTGGTPLGGQGGVGTAGSASAQGGSASGAAGGASAAGGSGGAPVAGTGQGASAGSGASAAGGLAGAGAAAGTTSAAGMAGAGGSAGASGAGGGTGDGTLGNGMMTGMGRSEEQYETQAVGRNGVPYELITNGWGPGFTSHTVSWNGTSFIVEAMMGSRGSGGQPASYPSVFCGKYSVMQVPDCGLPRAIDQITSLKTGWRWAANGNTGAYNAAYDIWLGTATGFGMYLMVWLRDPPGEQPAGSPDAANQGVTVMNVPGVWDIWSGSVNSRPIINWVRREGMDSPDIEFDVMDFIRDAQTRGLTLTGTQVNAVAVGFEIWQGPVTNLESTDFYVDVK